MAPVSRETARATQPGDVTPSITDPTRDATTPDPATGEGTTTEAGPTGSGKQVRSGYHDSISGQPVTEDGQFVNEPGRTVTDKSHIVADNWPDLQVEQPDRNRRTE